MAPVVHAGYAAPTSSHPEGGDGGEPDFERAEPGGGEAKELADEHPEREVMADNNDVFASGMEQLAGQRLEPEPEVLDAFATRHSGPPTVVARPRFEELREALAHLGEAHALGFTDVELGQGIDDLGLETVAEGNQFGDLKRAHQGAREHPRGRDLREAIRDGDGLGQPSFGERDVFAAEALSVAVVRSLTVANQVQGHASRSGALSGAQSRSMNGEKPIARQNPAAAASAVSTAISKWETPSWARAQSATWEKSARAMPILR